MTTDSGGFLLRRGSAFVAATEDIERQVLLGDDNLAAGQLVWRREVSEHPRLQRSGGSYSADSEQGIHLVSLFSSIF